MNLPETTTIHPGHDAVRYKQVSIEERRFIFQWHHNQKVGIREIARRLNRSPSTVSREIKRHTRFYYTHAYYPNPAQHHYRMMLRKRGQRLRLKTPETRAYVEAKIRDGWSPEIIAGRLRTSKEATPVSHEAIYQYVYKERNDLAALLPRKRQKRRSRIPYRKIPSESVTLKVPIAQRPEEINQRAAIGHWESDSVVDRNHGAINVIIERRTRLVHITKLPDPTAKSTESAITNALSRHPSEFVRSITYDNGSENARHHLINRVLNCESYFCEPYHSWEKGAVENVNEKIRRYIPKKSDLSAVTQGQLSSIEQRLNMRPRKCLGFRTPFEVYHEVLPTILQLPKPSVALSH